MRNKLNEGVDYEQIANRIAAIIKGKGHSVVLFTNDGMETTNPEKARRFYVKDPNYMITLDDDNGIVRINKNGNVKLEEMENIIKQIRTLARHFMMNTELKVFGKDIVPKDFSYQAKKYKEKEMDKVSEGYGYGPSHTVFLPTNKGVKKIVTGAKDPSEAIEIAVQRAIKKGFDPGRALDMDWTMKMGDDGRMHLRVKSRSNVDENVGEYYADYDDDTGMWCVFHTDKKSGHAYASYSSKEEAKQKADKMNKKVTEAALSRMHGSKKTSYQTLESVKIVVRHAKPVAEEVRGARSRQIKEIFIERAGERIRFPHNNLAGARAMARHMSAGGEMTDSVGSYITEAVANLIKLNEFIRYSRTNKLINEDSEDIIKVVRENIEAYKTELHRFTGTKSYGAMVEQLKARGDVNAIEEDTDELRNMFTVRKFDENLTDTLPLIKRLVTEKNAWRSRIEEASTVEFRVSTAEDLIEAGLLEFDSPMQKMGYRIRNIAERVIEESELSKFVEKVAGKIIEGTELSKFERGIVRNVLENITVVEDEASQPTDKLEELAEAFAKKMSVIEDVDWGLNEARDRYDVFGGPSASIRHPFRSERRYLKRKVSYDEAVSAAQQAVAEWEAADHLNVEVSEPKDIDGALVWYVNYHTKDDEEFISYGVGNRRAIIAVAPTGKKLSENVDWNKEVANFKKRDAEAKERGKSRMSKLRARRPDLRGKYPFNVNVSEDQFDAVPESRTYKGKETLVSRILTKVAETLRKEADWHFDEEHYDAVIAGQYQDDANSLESLANLVRHGMNKKAAAAFDQLDSSVYDYFDTDILDASEIAKVFRYFKRAGSHEANDLNIAD